MNHSRLLGVGLALTMAATGCQTKTGPEPGPTMPAKIAKELRADFRRDRSFWEKHGIGGLATTKLVLLSGGETYDCPNGSTISSGDSSKYCVATGAIVLTAELAKEPQSWRTFAVGHEWGHRVQHVDGEMKHLPDQLYAGIASELNATCRAGQLMSTLNGPQTNKAVERELGSGYADAVHGTPEEQQGAFAYYGAVGNCPSVAESEWTDWVHHKPIPH